VLYWSGEEAKKSVSVDLVKDIQFPIAIIYNHEGGTEGYLKIQWLSNDQSAQEQATVHFFHSPAQKQQMDRISILNE
jgi:hypothetical protein